MHTTPRLLRLAPLLLLAALAACTHAPPRNPIAQWVPSPNHEPRRPILIVLHATEQQSAEESLDTLRTANSGGPVSSHYLVGDDGAIYQLVSDELRAWHAGPGRWGTITDVNSASIGIEIDNDGSEPFTDAQIASLLRLLEDLCERLDIPRTQVIAHADMAPTRKRDPGAHFPWQRLAEAGFGLWPRGELADPPPGFDPMLALRLLGYALDRDDTPGHAATVRAFRRHFRGDERDVLDAEDARILHALTQAPPRSTATQSAPRQAVAAGLPYLVFETAGAAPDAELPLLIGLHYSGGTPEGTAAYFDRLAFPARVVLPRGPHPRPTGHSWFATGHGSLAPAAQAAAAEPVVASLAAFAEAVRTEHPTRGKPVVLGVSYGGDLALLLALRHPQAIDAAFPVAARLLPEWMPVAAAACAPACPPIRALHGTVDATVPVAPTAAAIDRLPALGFDATLVRYPGAGHDFTEEMERDFVRQVQAMFEAAP